MESAFVHAPLPSTRRIGLRRTARRPATVCAKLDEPQPTTPTRRQFLSTIGALPLLSALTIAKPLKVNADRTGKYSTKLTAKRRYLPRITTGFELLAQVNPQSNDNWSSAVNDFAQRLPDLLSALRLFATSFFAEGNRIGQTEKSLISCVADLERATDKLAAAVKTDDQVAARSAYVSAANAANCYIDTAKLAETIPNLPVPSPL